MYDTRPKRWVYTVIMDAESEYLSEWSTIPLVFTSIKIALDNKSNKIIRLKTQFAVK
jgi:hypothetical protein